MAKGASAAADTASAGLGDKFRTTPITATITRVKSLPKSAIICQCAASQFWQFRVFLEGKQHKRTTEQTDKDAALNKGSDAILMISWLRSVWLARGRVSPGHTSGASPA